MKWEAYCVTFMLGHCCPLECIVGFSKPNYTAAEGNRLVQLSLVLSNPSSTDIIVQVLDNDINGTATGKCDHLWHIYS